MRSAISVTVASLLATGCLAGPRPPLYPKFPAKETVNCRDGPKTDFAILTTFNKGEMIEIMCQQRSESVHGNNIWDHVKAQGFKDGCWVADYYVKTGKDDFVTRHC